MDKNSWFKTCKFYLIFIFVAVISQTAYAEHDEVQKVNELELSAVANLDKAALENDQWLSVLPVIGDDEQYFIATQAGKVYQLNNNEISESAFFDLKSALKNPNIIALTAITLDPNFHYRDRDGYQTFYTAHTEASKKTKAKLTPQNNTISTPYDTVLMRWQITSLHSQTPKLSQQNEVMRIAILQPQEHIQQLSFNPYIEPWHDDFGLLFIALARSDTLKHEALYAGAILRIKPEKHGLQHYTIPADNPFTKTVDIRNEIVFIAGQKTEHFDWIKKSTYSLLVQFNQHDANVLIEAKIGDDWREAIPQKQIKKHLPATNTKHKTLLYHGRELKNLWGKALHLQQIENDWQLQAIALNSTVNSEGLLQDTPHKLIKHNANEQAKFSLHQKHNGELLLLEHTQQRLYTIKVPEITMSKVAISDNSISASNYNSFFAFLFFIMFILMSYFWYSRKSSLKKQNLLHEQWANFEVDLTTQSLSLYKRHTNVAEQVISISSITGSELLLNDEVISTITVNSVPTFSNDLEDEVLAFFAKEHRLKMIDEKQRNIQLCLTDDQQNRYLFCLYLRIGNIRHTKLKYQQVINKVIDWQWFFAQFICPEVTPKRTIIVKPNRKKSVVNVVKKSVTEQVIHPEILEDNSTQVTQTIDVSLDSSAENNLSANNNLQDNQDGSANLVSALNKLVMMKKQGYLNENEFNVAKAKILKDLTND
ncbi:hypothetical protein H4J38_03765 [Colwellia sp. BRX10-3]|uniref:hypothetical protein n=1 Tax=Colwellia sp. BRX10-3 TaxID=2759844 RepID=UPI0015F54E03|nr:hypothetical protein [Colwellia sp. BRX10-3]MBA6389894.1 hypothetical protein [Colwellia sp. BRX10-3]